MTIPAKVLRAVGLQQGDDVYIGVNPDDPRTIVILPATLLHAWIEKGRRADAGVDG
ncbi:MAG: AbrB/MazE/SpoVT family DNA-binding domain-containing protein [Actinomycetota bacterium]|nr:AbrB/MazE/SpoVT family DNA-binding domain-containing protein [Actinomycetota bacterium]